MRRRRSHGYVARDRAIRGFARCGLRRACRPRLSGRTGGPTALGQGDGAARRRGHAAPSEEQRRTIEAEIEFGRADRARLSAVLIETTAKVQDAERGAAAAADRLANLNVAADEPRVPSSAGAA